MNFEIASVKFMLGKAVYEFFHFIWFQRIQIDIIFFFYFFQLFCYLFHFRKIFREILWGRNNQFWLGTARTDRDSNPGSGLPDFWI